MKTQNILILLIILLVTGGFFYFLNMPEEPQVAEVQQYVWMIEMEEIKQITIELPREDKKQSFFMDRSDETKFPWYFDDEDKSPVDNIRWGGGIPLLLSGPGAGRIIALNAPESKLSEFGLTNPKMVITLTLDDGYVMIINVGDATPNTAYYYVQAPGTNDVALVDYTWHDVLARLVLEPPYATEE